MAAETKTRGGVREHKETLLLLKKWGDENIQLQLKSCTRKKPIWLEISAYLQAAGYEDRDDGSCETRIHTLIGAYRSSEVLYPIIIAPALASLLPKGLRPAFTPNSK